jgi:LL-diaminopimelate aminotransferase
MRRNPYFSQVRNHYLFHEVKQRKLEFLKQNPNAKLISLSIGDTTEPLQPHTLAGLIEGSKRLGSQPGYQGYGPEQGFSELREVISKKIYNSKINPADIFVSDGAKCDIGRLQTLFGPNCRIALQDPAYPAYIDTSIIHRGSALTPILLPCTPENNFFPDISLAKDADVIFLCSPNNPTGTALTHSELEQIVSFARKEKKLIVFDAAYLAYVQGDFPRSIYEIPHAEDVAIEIGSFSKMAGFSGVRLGWTTIPAKLTYQTGEKLQDDWLRLITTFYNGASSIAQHGGIAALSDEGQKEIKTQVSFYLQNAKLLKTALENAHFDTFGGIHSPYLWVRLKNKSSWQAFDELLNNAHIITTPGSGFGNCGEGFLRISSFGTRSDIEEAASRISKIF